MLSEPLQWTPCDRDFPSRQEEWWYFWWYLDFGNLENPAFMRVSGRHVNDALLKGLRQP